MTRFDHIDPAPAAAAPVDGPDPWQVQLLRRAGAPPIRFSGCCLCHHGARMGEEEAWITLWRMRRGGFVVGFARPDGDGWQADALRAPDLEAAMEGIESVCAALAAGPEAADVPEGPDALVAALNRQARRAGRVAVFAHLAGEALEVWDRLQHQAGQGG